MIKYTTIRIRSKIRSRYQRGGWWSLAAVLVLSVSALAQTGPLPASGSATAPVDKVRGAYAVGPGDVLEIRVADAPEISGKYRISEAGELSLPMLKTPLKASGLTTVELSKSIAESLKAAEILREPLVTAFVDQYRSRNVMVLGSVAKPGVYSLEKRTTLLELLSLAGGLLPTASNTLTIAPKGILSTGENVSVSQTPPPGETTVTIDLTKLVTGKDPSLNVEAQPGDVVSVPAAPFVYVVGAVRKPGGFLLQDAKSGLTVLQALALAEGFGPAASPSRAIIVRRSASRTDRQEIAVNLSRIMTGKTRDLVLEGNDILFIPESGFKKGVRRLGDAALVAASSAVGYGYGLRIAPPGSGR